MKKELKIETEACILNYTELKEYAITLLNENIENNILTQEDLDEHIDFIIERLNYGNTMNNVMYSISDDEIKEFSINTGAYDEIEEDSADEWDANKWLIRDKICNDIIAYCKENKIVLDLDY